MKRPIVWLLVILSIPFFVVGFLYEFIAQGINDGRQIERDMESNLE